LTRAAAAGPHHVYLSDFGLSKQALSALGLTATGQLVGTLDYVAPEQIENRPPVDGRADLYALACATFELLSGPAAVHNRDQRLAVLWAQLSEPPPPLTAPPPGPAARGRPDHGEGTGQVTRRPVRTMPRLRRGAGGGGRAEAGWMRGGRGPLAPVDPGRVSPVGGRPAQKSPPRA